MSVFWKVATFSLVDIDGHFKGACCFYRHGDRPEVSSTLQGETSGKAINLIIILNPASAVTFL